MDVAMTLQEQKLRKGTIVDRSFATWRTTNKSQLHNSKNNNQASATEDIFKIYS